eukprot:6826715-Alexandrium_andersonii.AAC.1
MVAAPVLAEVPRGAARRRRSVGLAEEDLARAVLRHARPPRREGARGEAAVALLQGRAARP